MKLHKTGLVIIFAVIFLMLCPVISEAQCAMCKAVLENEYIASGNRKSEGINGGILFLMGIPYLLIGVSLLYYFKYRPKKQSASNGEG